MTDEVKQEETKQTTTTKDDGKAEVDKLRSIAKEAFFQRDELKAKLKDIEPIVGEVEGLRKTLSEKESALQALQEQARSEFANIALATALKSANVASVETAFKLVDRAKLEYDGMKVKEDSVKKVVEELQKEHSVLFGKPQKDTPPPASAGGESGKGGYLAELQALRESGRATPMMVQALRHKYGKIY